MLKTVLLTDAHIDLEYKAGTLANCGDYLCCREENGYPSSPDQEAAGEWGSTTCDTPIKTLENMLDHIANEVKPDAIFWAGDNSPHNIWSLSNEEVTEYTIKVSQMLKEKFDKTDITIIPI